MRALLERAQALAAVAVCSLCGSAMLGLLMLERKLHKRKNLGRRGGEVSS